MAEISIIEFLVYALLAYSGILLLIVSAFREESTASRSKTGVKVIWLIPCIFATILLAGAGQDITFTTVNTVNTITNNVTNTVDFTEDVVKTTKIVLVQPVWGMVHILLFFVLLIYVIQQVLIMFTRHD